MIIKNIYTALLGTLLTMTVTGCEGEKELVIIEGNLPIKTSTLYMVGDATPNGWSIDSPTPLEPTPEDPLVFTWEGNLNPGEMKLCLAPGSFDAPFIRPMNNGEEIGKAEITDAEFQMHAGDPDEKWRIVEPGVYFLSFNLRDWTMSSKYLRAPDAPVIEPIQSDALYIVGDATPNGWNIDSPTPLEKKSDYVFEWEGPLTAGDFKACATTGSWDVPFVRPVNDGCVISKTGAENPDFMYCAAPDTKWHVADEGIYHLYFDLEHYTIVAEYKGEIVNEKKPIETATLYMIGDATPGGWSLGDATAFTVSESNKYIFTWEGELVPGTFKACPVNNSFDVPFIRPASSDCVVSSAGVSSPDFVYTTNPDDKWNVTEAGTYRIAFDLENWTISVQYLDSEEEKEPIETSTLYMIGDATPGGWSMDAATAFTQSPDNKYVFTWEGNLKTGSMKACLQPDGTFSCPFLRPTSDGCKINADGVASPDFVYTTAPDDKWQVEKDGKYTLTFNLKDWSFKAEYHDK